MRRSDTPPRPRSRRRPQQVRWSSPGRTVRYAVPGRRARLLEARRDAAGVPARPVRADPPRDGRCHRRRPAEGRGQAPGSCRTPRPCSARRSRSRSSPVRGRPEGLLRRGEADQLRGAPYESVETMLAGEWMHRQMGARYEATMTELRDAANIEGVAALPGSEAARGRASATRSGARRGDAPVTIVQFAEYQCYYCNKVQPTLDALRRRLRRARSRWSTRTFRSRTTSARCPQPSQPGAQASRTSTGRCRRGCSPTRAR